jgi:hypothetical protein
MVQPLRSLADLELHGGSIHATCRGCNRVAIFAVGELLAHYRRRKLTLNWPAFAQYLRCKTCGDNHPEVVWEPSNPPPGDNPPLPRPRFSRPAVAEAPLGVYAMSGTTRETMGNVEG